LIVSALIFVDDDFVGGFDFENNEDEHAHNAPDFNCLSPDDIVNAQKKQIAEICELLMISASSASLLLRAYGWKPEKLIQKYFDDPERVIEEAGVLVDTFDGEAEAKLVDDGECLVCTDICSPEDRFATTILSEYFLSPFLTFLVVL
jgi:ariadne-1